MEENKQPNWRIIAGVIIALIFVVSFFRNSDRYSERYGATNGEKEQSTLPGIPEGVIQACRTKLKSEENLDRMPFIDWRDKRSWCNGGTCMVVGVVELSDTFTVSCKSKLSQSDHWEAVDLKVFVD